MGCEARIHLRLPKDVFIKSFKHRETLRLEGSLSTLVETVMESFAEECAILCEVKPSGDV